MNGFTMLILLGLMFTLLLFVGIPLLIMVFGVIGGTIGAL